MRKANLIQTAIWLDPDFASLTSDAKLLYLLLLTQADVTHVGVLTLAAKRWTRQLSITPPRFQRALRELVDHHFVVHDQDTDELLIRSWVKHNLRGSNLETAGRSHFQLVESALIRWTLQVGHPDLFGDPPTEPPMQPPSTPPTSKGGYRDRSREVVSSSSENEQARAQGDLIWAEYHERHPRSVYGPPRRQLVNRWLDVYPVDMLVDAIRGNHLDPYCNGENQTGTQYHDFELIFRDEKHIEKYSAIARNGAPRPPATSSAGKTLELMRREATQLEQRSR